MSRITAPNHIERVKHLPCVVCGTYPCHAHHIRTHETTGRGQRADDFDAIPLCELHHDNHPGSFHKMGREQWESIYGTQRKHVTQTLKTLYENEGLYGLILGRNKVLANRVQELEKMLRETNVKKAS